MFTPSSACGFVTRDGFEFLIEAGISVLDFGLTVLGAVPLIFAPEAEARFTLLSGAASKTSAALMDGFMVLFAALGVWVTVADESLSATEGGLLPLFIPG